MKRRKEEEGGKREILRWKKIKGEKGGSTREGRKKREGKKSDSEGEGKKRRKEERRGERFRG